MAMRRWNEVTTTTKKKKKRKHNNLVAIPWNATHNSKEARARERERDRNIIKTLAVNSLIMFSQSICGFPYVAFYNILS
jgi:hypothetical protein